MRIFLLIAGLLLQLPIKSVALAQEVNLICDIRQNIRSFNERQQIIQDDVHVFRKEFQLTDGSYFVTTTDTRGNAYHDQGAVQITPGKYFLISIHSADGVGGGADFG